MCVSICNVVQLVHNSAWVDLENVLRSEEVKHKFMQLSDHAQNRYTHRQARTGSCQGLGGRSSEGR